MLDILSGLGSGVLTLAVYPNLAAVPAEADRTKDARTARRPCEHSSGPLLVFMLHM